MRKRIAEPTQRPKERAFLVGVELNNQESYLPLSDSLAELGLLAQTAGLEVVGTATQKLDHLNPKYFVGPGKAEEIKLLAEEVQADVLIFDDELSPRHLREWERLLGEHIRILDRTALILDIFAQHAHTREGALQVELAQYEYRLPRLTRAWTHLARQAGGGGGRTGSVGGVGLRGPGETQLEVDRRDIRRRIAQLKDELEKVRVHRMQYRQRRKKSKMPLITLVGYTNAGKSTLLNQMSHADVFVADQLFATLDPTTRRVALPGGHVCLVTDTVGFIQKLPTQLVAAFRATLEEIAEADMLLHVVDIVHPNAVAQAQAVHDTLEQIGADRIPMITVLNKIDLLENPEQAQIAIANFPNSVAVSALKGIGLERLLEVIAHQLFETFVPFQVSIPYGEGAILALIYEHGHIEQVDHRLDSVNIRGSMPLRFFAQLQPFILQKKITEAAL